MTEFHYLYPIMSGLFDTLPKVFFWGGRGGSVPVVVCHYKTIIQLPEAVAGELAKLEMPRR